MMMGRRRQSGTPLAESATEFLQAAKTMFERLDRGTAIIHGRKQPINGDVGLLRCADDLQQSEKDLLELYRKVTCTLPGSQGIRRQFNATCLGFRMMFGDVCFFTATPDRRHSKLVWRLMRCRRNDTGLLDDDAATTWRRRYAGPDTPSLYALPEDDIAEQQTFEVDLARLQSIPAVAEAIAMSARDPLSTVLHYDVYVRVILAYITGMRICLHCPSCNSERLDETSAVRKGIHSERRACQNKFGKNARIMGGTFAMAESLAACTEHQGNDTPHIHGLMAVACPYQYKTLLEIRELIERDVTEVDRIQRFIQHMCREDHYDDDAHQQSLASLEKAKNDGLAGSPHIRISDKPSFLLPRRMPGTQPSLWDTAVTRPLQEKDLAGAVPSPSASGSATGFIPVEPVAASTTPPGAVHSTTAAAFSANTSDDSRERQSWSSRHLPLVSQ